MFCYADTVLIGYFMENADAGVYRDHVSITTGLLSLDRPKESFKVATGSSNSKQPTRSYFDSCAGDHRYCCGNIFDNDAKRSTYILCVEADH